MKHTKYAASNSIVAIGEIHSFGVIVALGRLV